MLFQIGTSLLAQNNPMGGYAAPAAQRLDSKGIPSGSNIWWWGNEPGP